MRLRRPRNARSTSHPSGSAKRRVPVDGVIWRRLGRRPIGSVRTTGRLPGRVFPLIIVYVAYHLGLASGPQFVNADNISISEHIADPHVDPRARRRFAKTPQKFVDEQLPLLLLRQVGHGDFSGHLRRRSAASSVRSTLLGEAGWHRADFAEARTLDDGPYLSSVDQIAQEPTGRRDRPTSSRD